jgi:hypothetical protein
MLRFQNGNQPSEFMPTLNTTCPVCDAPHAKRLSTIYSEGFSTSTGTLKSVGQFDTIGRQKITTTGTTKGVTQTAASMEAAPPDAPVFISKGQHKRRAIWFVTGLIAMLAFLLVAVTTGVESALLASGVVIILGMAVSLTVDASPLADEEKEHRMEFAEEYEAHEKWQETFACTSCGHRFLPREINT